MRTLTLTLLQINPRRKEFLAIAFVLSIGLHAGLLSLSRQTGGPDSPVSNILEVALVNTHTQLAPLDPQLLAQDNLLGGGSHKNAASSTPLPVTTPTSANEIVLAALEKRRQALEERQHELLQQAESQQQVSAGEAHEGDTPDQADRGVDDRNQPSLIVNAQIAQLKAEIEKYNALPRQHYTGPSARRHSYARYLETWRQHIEQLGTEYYPEQARGRIYGSLQLTVYINTDGSLAKVEIDRPSEHPILNAAALRIVQLAAPFAPLGKEITKETDVLAITRTWHFQNAQLTTHQP